jgi:hypothetical protein
MIVAMTGIKAWLGVSRMAAIMKPSVPTTNAPRASQKLGEIRTADRIEGDPAPDAAGQPEKQA